EQRGEPLFVPSIALDELQYLAELGRIAAAAHARVHTAVAGAIPTLLLVPLDRAVAHAVGQVPRREVPELPDRIIAATALHLGVPLITRDQVLRASSIQTIW